MDKWISVRDEPPKDYEKVLLASDIAHFVGFRLPDGKFSVFGVRLDNITHWTPLPELPTK